MLGLFDLAFLSTKVSNLATSDYKSVVSVNLFVALLCACIIVGHLLEENRWINESITALAIVRFLFVVCTLHCVTRVKWLVFICVWQGLCTGVVILLTSKGKSSHLLVFSEDLFFIYLLPPIIFNAGYVVLYLPTLHLFSVKET